MEGEEVVGWSEGEREERSMVVGGLVTLPPPHGCLITSATSQVMLTMQGSTATILHSWNKIAG